MKSCIVSIRHLLSGRLLVFEYYGHGNPVGTSVTLGYCEVNDFLGAVAYAKARAPQTHLGVLDYSMGAAVAIMGSAWTPEIEALVADSAFATHRSAVDYKVRHVLHLPSAPFLWLADALLWWRAGYHFRQVEPLREIGAAAPRPILLIHGGNDSVVDPRDAVRLYEAVREPKELWLLPEAEHCGAYFVDRRAYVAKINAFFDRSLRQAPPRWPLEATPPGGSANLPMLRNKNRTKAIGYTENRERAFSTIGATRRMREGGRNSC